MNYQVGKIGRVVVARFENDEKLLEGLTGIIKKEDIRVGLLYLIGGLKKGKFVVGPEEDVIPPTPIWREIDESHEVLGLGTVFWQNDEPKIHFHGAYGKKDIVKAGCLRENAEVYLVLEAVIIEIDGINAIRELDPASGLSLLKLI